jgi:hypothetical protein
MYTAQGAGIIVGHFPDALTRSTVMKRAILLVLFAFALSTTAMADSDFGGIGGAGTGFPGALTGSKDSGFTLTMELDSMSNNGKTTTGALEP